MSSTPYMSPKVLTEDQTVARYEGLLREVVPPQLLPGVLMMIRSSYICGHNFATAQFIREMREGMGVDKNH